MAILIGIDIGTTSWKVAAFRFNGEMVAIQKTPTVTQNYAKGQNFYDPQQLWRDTSEIIKKLLIPVIKRRLQVYRSPVWLNPLCPSTLVEKHVFQ